MEHNDPPGYQSREAVRIQRQLPGAGGFGRRMTYQELQDVDNVIVGSPDTVTRKLSNIIERLNPGYLHIYGNEGDMAHEDVMRSVELLGKRGPSRPSTKSSCSPMSSLNCDSLSLE